MGVGGRIQGEGWEGGGSGGARQGRRKSMRLGAAALAGASASPCRHGRTPNRLPLPPVAHAVQLAQQVTLSKWGHTYESFPRHPPQRHHTHFPSPPALLHLRSGVGADERPRRAHLGIVVGV